jgi:hypothetical protein
LRFLTNFNILIINIQPVNKQNAEDESDMYCAEIAENHEINIRFVTKKKFRQFYVNEKAYYNSTTMKNIFNAFIFIAFLPYWELHAL